MSKVLLLARFASMVLLAGAAHPENPTTASPPPVASQPLADAQATADAISREIEQLRGLKFKQPVRVESQSTEDFGKFVAREMDENVPESLRKHYGAIVRELGLYSGPPIEDFSAMMTRVMTSQVAAYYDPEKQGFYMVMSNLPEFMRGVMYSHELYHAMQDQYFGLVKYMKPGGRSRDDEFNSDNRLARSAVVEGEATYVMNLWTIQKMTGKPPAREIMAKVIPLQANMSMDQMREAMKQQNVADLVGKDAANSIDASREIPNFIMDTLIGAYLKGMSFVFAVQEQGWTTVEKLYTEYPPQSTEQILHAEKWLAREAPVTFEWPKFSSVAALRDWELLDDDVLGEFQWRIVFKEQGLAAEAESASAGWGGDRYAVFKRKDTDDMLLLLRTCWDNEHEAKEFVDAYRRALARKYTGQSVPTRVVQKGADVFIVEGGEEAKIDSLLKFVSRVKPRKAKPA